MIKIHLFFCFGLKSAGKSFLFGGKLESWKLRKPNFAVTALPFGGGRRILESGLLYVCCLWDRRVWVPGSSSSSGIAQPEMTPTGQPDILIDVVVHMVLYTILLWQRMCPPSPAALPDQLLNPRTPACESVWPNASSRSESWCRKPNASNMAQNCCPLVSPFLCIIRRKTNFEGQLIFSSSQSLVSPPLQPRSWSVVQGPPPPTNGWTSTRTYSEAPTQTPDWPTRNALGVRTHLWSRFCHHNTTWIWCCRPWPHSRRCWTLWRTLWSRSRCGIWCCRALPRNMRCWILWSWPYYGSRSVVQGSDVVYFWIVQIEFIIN